MMMECTKTHGPCSWKPPPPPPPCPPPKKKPFPWHYPAALIALLTLIGLLYQYYLYLLRRAIESKPVWQPRKKDKSPESEFDLPKCVPYVLVGAGPAAWSAFEEIKNQDPKYRVLFITDEDAMPYKRMPMSRHMWWMDNTPDYAKLMYTEDEEFKSMYQTKCKDFMDIFKFSKRKRGPALALAMGWEVVEVDPDYHMVWVKTICGERPIYYERCLLATGALPRTLTVLRQSSKEVRKLVTTFRTLRDLELAFRRVREAKHITIIGGGLLGTELAWFLGRMYKMLLHQQQDKDSEPLKITLLSKDQGLMSSILPSYLSEWCVERLKDCNITILPKVQAYDFCKSDDGKLQITLSNGTNLVTDFAFLCIGAKARTDIARRSNLETDPINGGYVCNSEMQIRRHLFTAGDVASTYIQWKDTRMRFEHLENAIMTGRIAGGNMTGLWEPCELEPQYELRLGKTIDFQVVGEVGGCMPTIGLFKPCEGKDTSNIDHLTEEEQAMPCNIKKDEYMNRFKHGIVFFLRGEYIVGIMFWNMPKKIDDRAAVASEMLRARPTHEDVNLLAEQLGFFDQECSVGKFEEKLDIPCPMVDKSRMKFPDVD